MQTTRLILIVCLLPLFTSCAQASPSSDQATGAITTWYKSRATSDLGFQVRILRIGDKGKGDFAAPGSQDSYWPVEFTIVAKVIDAGPLQVSADKVHGVAKMWKDKLGTWKIGDVEELPIERSR